MVVNIPFLENFSEFLFWTWLFIAPMIPLYIMGIILAIIGWILGGLKKKSIY